MKTLSNLRRFKPADRGAVLVVTLIVCAVLAAVLVAMMQNTTLDRASSRSIANQYRAQLAAEAGLAEFVSSLTALVATNDFAVVAATNGTTNFTVVARFLPGGALKVYPLVSSSNRITNPINVTSPFTMPQMFAAASAVTNGANSTNLNTIFERFGGIEYPATDSSAINLGAQFVRYSTNSADAAEYAFVASDECAKLNISRYGSAYTTGARANQSPSEFVSQIAVADSGSSTVTASQWAKFTDLPAELRLGAMFPSVFGSTNERAQKNRFYSDHQGEVFDFIPQGSLNDARTTFTAYADGGKFKYDLNKLATNSLDSQTNAFVIADVISSNLPNFYKRDPSFAIDSKKPSDPLLRYNRRIAASIVDYVDSDSVPTTITDGEPAGKERVAYPIQIAERYYWASATPAAATINHTLYVQLWNPYTETVNGDFRYELETLRPFKENGANETPIPKLAGSVTVSLQPNQIQVFEIASQSISVPLTTTPPDIQLEATSPSTAGKPQPSRFKAFWNGQMYDQTASYNTALFDPQASGLAKSGPRTIDSSSTALDPVWAANVGQTERTTAGGCTSVADPRQNVFNSYDWKAAAYFSATKDLRWNGASVYAASSANTQRFHETWAVRDTLRPGASGYALPKGQFGTPTTGTIPTNVQSSYNASSDSQDAPAYVNNAPMSTPAELGHIYDPVHLDDGGSVYKGGTPGSYYSAGGGRTLRIGQPEFNYPTFALGGQRAINLLDLFAVNQSNPATNTVTNARAANLNINTAPTDVLAAFFCNLAPVSDQGVTTVNKISLTGATNIATNIIAGRPYYTDSDMHRFMHALIDPGNYSPALPTNNPASTSVVNMLDRGREEVFRRAYDSLSTKSGAFRFYGVGRSLSPGGQIQSQVVLDAVVELRATNDASGKPTLRAIVTQRKFL
jgi:Tfp pilus assembly protein PilX